MKNKLWYRLEQLSWQKSSLTVWWETYYITCRLWRHLIISTALYRRKHQLTDETVFNSGVTIFTPLLIHHELTLRMQGSTPSEKESSRAGWSTQSSCKPCTAGHFVQFSSLWGYTDMTYWGNKRRLHSAQELGSIFSWKLSWGRRKALNKWNSDMVRPYYIWIFEHMTLLYLKISAVQLRILYFKIFGNKQT